MSASREARVLKGDSAYLLSAMSQYGYSLLQPDNMADPNELLTALSCSKDARVLEGFPVVLANALEKHREKVDFGSALLHLPGESDRERFRRLVALSFYLFDTFGFGNLKPRDAQARLLSESLLNEMRNAMVHNQPLLLDGREMDPGRATRTFLNYYVETREAERTGAKAQLREDFRREYNLSLFFAPKQRDLLKKKLRGEPLTKTEREYFSRVVKKKLLALADPDVQRLALKALQ